MSEERGSGTRARKKRDKRQRLEAAGRALFSELGFEQATTRELARTAGVGAGTFFLYFHEKRDLLLHLFHRDVVEVNERAFSTVPSQAPLLEAVTHVFQRCLDYYERDMRLSRVFLRELLFTDPEVRRRYSDEDGFARRLAGLARRAQERGELRGDVDAGQTALLLLDLYLFALIAWVGGSIPTRAGIDARLRDNLRLCIQGLSHPERAG